MYKDHEHGLIRYSYSKETKIYPHTHNANELVIATHGHFRDDSEGNEKEYNPDGNETVIIHYPVGTEHSLTFLGDVLDYFVMRNK